MSSLRLEDTMNALFLRHLSLSQQQTQRLSCACVGMLLAGTAQLPHIARWLNRAGQQNSRIQFLSRLLDASYVDAQQVYHPMLKSALSRWKDPTCHLVLDRTSLVAHEVDLLSVSLNFRKRAIPLVWQVMDFGSSSAQQQTALLQQVLPLLPAQAVVLHGDSEFGSVEMMRWLRQQQWDFILAQGKNTLYRPDDGLGWQVLKALPVTPRHAIYLQNVQWTQQHCYEPVNLFAFYYPHRSSLWNAKQEVCYCTTSLPIAHTLRRVGRRRWGIECFFRDYKSSGWRVDTCRLTDYARWEALLSLLSVDYLWMTCLGRWLCKTGQRPLVDARPQRHLSLFRLGWDWLIHLVAMGDTPPPLLALYT